MFVVASVMLIASCGGSSGTVTDAPSAIDAIVARDGGIDGAVSMPDASVITPGSCQPQTISTCSCDGGGSGTSECIADGTGYAACECTIYGREIFVSTTGDDGAAGTSAAPLATLDAALAIVRGLEAGPGLPSGGVAISMAGGEYPITQPVVIGADVSGTADSPVVIRAQAGAAVRLFGGAKLSPSQFTAVADDDPAIARVDTTALPNLVVADLGAAGITDFGTFAQRGFCTGPANSALELFVDGTPMWLGRWPDVDDNTSAGVNHGFANTNSGVSTTAFTYSQTQPNRWSGESDAWVHGFFAYDWADCHVSIASINTASKTITVGQAPTYGITGDQPWYAYNLLEEVTEPGEWYLDHSSGRLYFYPPYDLSDADIQVSLSETPLLTLNQASYVQVQGLVLETSRTDLVQINGGAHNRLIGVTLRNSGRNGASITGVDNGVQGALITQVGRSGVTLDGGDRPSLTPANNFVERSNIFQYARWDWTYNPAVSMTGVAERASHNRIHDAPHQALFYSGNEHLIEFNEIYNVLQFTNDAGAIYSGRDWGGRGVVIHNNYLHDLQTYFPGGNAIVGVYLDDCQAGDSILGNILADIGGKAILHGGGRDDLMNGNIIVRADEGFASDARCSSWAIPSQVSGVSTNYLQKLEANNYQMPPWSDRYPTCAAIPDSYAQIEATGATWLFPGGSTFNSNVGFSDSEWMGDEDDSFNYFTQANDMESSVSPFVDEAGGDLAQTSAVLAIPGFTAIPIAQIGIH